MTASEERAEITKLANEVNDLRLKIVALAGELTPIILKCVNAAEALLPSAVAEHDTKPVVKKVVYDVDDEGNQVPVQKDRASIEEVAEGARPRRKCSNCGEPGHRATTCTNVRKEASRKVRRKRG